MNPLWRAGGAVVESALGVRERVAGPRAGLTVVGWHRVDDAPGGLSTTAAELRGHLDVIEENGCTVVALDEGLRALAGGTLPSHAVALTFDDGYASVAEVAWPEVARRGWPATLYAVAGYLQGGERFPWDDRSDGGAAQLLDAAGLRDLAAAGMTVGSHTVTHRWLPHLTPGEVVVEVRNSKALLEDLLGLAVPSFSYPMGGWNAAVRRAVIDAGYRNAVTVDRGRTTGRTDVFAVRRAFAPRSAVDFRRILAGAYTFLRPLDRWRIRSGPAWQD